MSIRYVGYGFSLLQRLRVGGVSGRQPESVDLDDALCVPLTHLPGGELRLTGGVFRSDGGYVAASGLVTGKRTIVGAATAPLPPAARSLRGRSLFLGICHYHYGHFLVETLLRLWCVGQRELETFDHIPILLLNNHVAAYIQARREHMAGHVALRTGFNPEIIDAKTGARNTARGRDHRLL